MNIYVNRRSVCMGDDCESHEKVIKLCEDMKFEEFLKKLISGEMVWSLPSIAQWSVYYVPNSSKGTDVSIDKWNLVGMISDYNKAVQAEKDINVFELIDAANSGCFYFE